MKGPYWRFLGGPWCHTIYLEQRQCVSDHKPFDLNRWLGTFLLDAEMLVFGKANILYLFIIIIFLLHSTMEHLTHYVVLLWHICEVGRALDKNPWHELKGPQQVIVLWRWAWLQISFFPEPPWKSPCGQPWHFSFHICSGWWWWGTGERKEGPWALSGLEQEASKSSANGSCKQFCSTHREYGSVIMKTLARNFHNSKVSTSRCFLVFAKRLISLLKCLFLRYLSCLTCAFLCRWSQLFLLFLWWMMRGAEMANILWSQVNFGGRLYSPKPLSWGRNGLPGFSLLFWEQWKENTGWRKCSHAELQRWGLAWQGCSGTI